MDNLLKRILFDAPPTQNVAFGAQGARDIAAFRTDVGRLSAYLSDHADPGQTVILACTNDRYAFVVALFSSWVQGISVALPPNTRPETLTQIHQDAHVRALIHDMDFDGGIHIDAWLQGAGAPETQPSAEGSHIVPHVWAADAVIATVYSSGTTGGVPNAAPKTTAQLLGEARMLARTLFPPDARVISTVHPGHIYGLLYSVLAPLCCGGAFMRETPFFPESVSAAVRAYDATVLVTVPAHLATFERIAPADFAPLERMVSSTAPLDEGLSTRLHARFQREITEVLGSSETGGMAVRNMPKDTLWTPLDEVSLRAGEDGRLWVDSPYLSSSLERPYRSADRVQFHGDRFAHLGRMDGVVKIGGRRVSLPEMEARVLALDGVHDAAVLVEDTDGLRGKRLQLAVVAEHADKNAIRIHLQQYFDASSVPRRIRFVKQLPREANGKLQRARLADIFQAPVQNGVQNIAHASSVQHIRWLERSISAAPEITPTATSVPSARYPIEIPASYPWFQGHFDEYPIMAAAVQMHDIIAPAVQKFLGEGYIRHIPRMKFSRIIQPDDQLEVRVEGEPSAVKFSIWRADTCCTSGRLIWEMPS